MHCLVEFYGIVTHPRIWKRPSTPLEARNQIESWLEAPSVSLLSDGHSTLDHMLDSLIKGQVVGAMVHDARIAAVCRSHGVSEFWSFDRDFSRFPSLKTRNPIAG